MRTFCTIITSNYFAYATTLYRSLVTFQAGEKLVVLVCDNEVSVENSTPLPGVSLVAIKELLPFAETAFLYDKYSDNMDALRWSMKPVLLRYLLANGYEKAIYVDCDIFFFNGYDFLYDELDSADILLTPCWRTIDAKKSEEEFIHLFTDGLYNAGFIAANKNSSRALEWWTKACSYEIKIDYERGLFVDQKYLDILPLMFENVKILKHKGCNVSIWNQHECRRINNNGQVLINGIEPVVFIHYNINYIKELMKGNDSLLFPYFKQYEAVFAESGFKLTDFIKDLPEYKKTGVLKTIKQKTLLRTRFKNFMYKLIDKI